MQHRASVSLLAIVLVVGQGCRSQPAQQRGPILAPPPPVTTEMEMATLSFLSYLGGKLEGSDAEVEARLHGCMREALAAQPLTAKKWDLVWGPAVFKFALAELDDNMMFVVQDVTQPAHYAVVVRGTNAAAALDWLLEVFNVHDQLTWSEVLAATGGGGPRAAPPPDAKIAKGIYDGLAALTGMVPDDGPGAGSTLKEFLAGVSQRHRGVPLHVEVTGHSLGGALSPVLGLWLADTQPSWDPAGSARLSVWAFAGPTPGNQPFAAYYRSRLGDAAARVWNPLDVIPKAWEVATLEEVADLYEPLTRADAVERALLDAARDRVKDEGYAQPLPRATPLPAALNSAYPTFTKQLGWQHHCGYQCALLINVPLTSHCPSDPELDCATADCPASLQ